MRGIRLDRDHHNGHLNEEKEGFDNCYPVVVCCESKDEAREVAKVVSDRFGDGGEE